MVNHPKPTAPVRKNSKLPSTTPSPAIRPHPPQVRPIPTPPQSQPQPPPAPISNSTTPPNNPSNNNPPPLNQPRLSLSNASTAQRVEMLRQYYSQLMNNLRSVSMQLQQVPLPMHGQPDPHVQRRQILLAQQERLKKTLQEFTERVMKPNAAAAAANLGTTMAPKVNKPPQQLQPTFTPPKIMQQFTGAQPVFMVPPGASPAAPQYASFAQQQQQFVQMQHYQQQQQHYQQAIIRQQQQQQQQQQQLQKASSSSSRTVSPPREEAVRTASDLNLPQEPPTRPPSTRQSTTQSPAKPTTISRPSSTLSLAPPNHAIAEPTANGSYLAAIDCKNSRILEQVDETGDDLIQFAIQLALHRIKTAPVGHQTPERLTSADMLLAIKLRGYELGRYEIEHVAHIKNLTSLPEPSHTLVKRSNTGPHMARMSQLKRHLASLSTTNESTAPE